MSRPLHCKSCGQVIHGSSKPWTWPELDPVEAKKREDLLTARDVENWEGVRKESESRLAEAVETLEWLSSEDRKNDQPEWYHAPAGERSTATGLTELSRREKTLRIHTRSVEQLKAEVEDASKRIERIKK